MASLRRVARNLVFDMRRLARIFRALDREAFAENYLKGDGIEIGALHYPLKVPSAAHVRYVDRLTVAELRKQYPELASQDLVEVDIIDNGEKLDTVGDRTLDFVIANHFIEHCENPIDALINIFRVLKKDGVLFMCVPDKRYTFDVDRPVTPFKHLVRDYTDGPAWSRTTHFAEWVRKVEKIIPDQQAQARVEELLRMNYSIHYHVWTQTELIEFVHRVKVEFNIPLEIELFMKEKGESILVLRKEA
jgi:predicted SAM-dependent methyltransferase